MSERLAGLESPNAEADPPVERGRLPVPEEESETSALASAGVVAAARMQEDSRSNTGSPPRGLRR
ncbi:MAG: hypothetical protein FWF31_10780, partial [Desulfobulbus sp.]|nr:hypothetical protein [Desulfobulbus sp.]